jgi:hypothetical protein
MENKVTVLFLAIYNETPDYIQMYSSHVNYLNYLKYNNFNPTYYFVIFKDLGHDDYLVDDKNYMLYINGRETFLPGILDKTIKALDVIHNKLKLEYDFIFRTNISTFIHFENTLSYLKNFAEPKKEMYYIGPLIRLQWLDNACGIVDKRYWGTAYCAGTCIIMSYALVENIIINRKKIHYNIIDDVSIGHYISQVENVKKVNIGTSLFSFKPHNLILNRKHLCYPNNYNKRRRKFDVDFLRKITEYFISKNKINVGHI